MKTKQTLNGVPVDELVETVAAVQADARIAKFTFRARNRWNDGGHNRAHVQDYYGATEEHARPEPFVVEMDEPPVLLGRDRGANPVEYVLAGLSGCLTTSLVYHAAARGITIRSVESTYEGDLDLRGFLGLDETVRNGYEGIRVTFRVDGDASDEELDEQVELARQRSPVYDIVTNRVPVSVTRET